jgi:hypothetical protein
MVNPRAIVLLLLVWHLISARWYVSGGMLQRVRAKRGQMARAPGIHDRWQKRGPRTFVCGR